MTKIPGIDDLRTWSFEAIIQLKSDVETVYTELLDKRKKESLQKITDLIKEANLSSTEIAQSLGLDFIAPPPTAVSSRKKEREKSPPKYQDPASDKTWNGRGKTPGFILDYEKDGKSRDDLLIQ
jgi:DNA-binding protein H-NS